MTNWYFSVAAKKSTHQCSRRMILNAAVIKYLLEQGSVSSAGDSYYRPTYRPRSLRSAQTGGYVHVPRVFDTHRMIRGLPSARSKRLLCAIAGAVNIRICRDQIFIVAVPVLTQRFLQAVRVFLGTMPAGTE
jgi:hypothetical protein